MAQRVPLHEAARLPSPVDNVAIATRRLEAGTEISHEGESFALDATVLEGHRFVVRPIPRGGELTSWGLPFGVALRDLSPGAYACTRRILDVLRERDVAMVLPPLPSFSDAPLVPYVLDERSFIPGSPVERYPEDSYFEGYPRPGGRGTGTRNYIVLLGTTSQTSGYVRALEDRLRGLADSYPDVDGIVAVAHTEGGAGAPPNNREVLLRALAGFMVHPNVGAVLAVDYGDEAVTNRHLQRYMEEHGYPLDSVLHRFHTVRSGFEESLEEGERIVRGWLDEVGSYRRERRPVSELRIALQCGGSDAFSGVSGNPLAAWVAREVIRYGGAANLAETDELIGAESYVLQNVRDLETARRFLETVERFKRLLAWHGQTAEGNPSGGNLFRGLYNITLKSLGAAMKRNPEVRLEHVIEYGERMREPGFHFMDSPGNDLESVAGQVASGCNMIFFVTGNGSITNFPFVPTIKVITTTGRYNLLPHEMDVNAGAYLDGTPMDELGREMFELTLRAASGERTKGELAGHSQVSIWRNWRQTSEEGAQEALSRPAPTGRPLDLRAGTERFSITARMYRTPEGYAADRIGLVLPTSLCSGQVARLIAERLNARRVGEGKVSRYVALPHTEGCGVAGPISTELYTRTMIGYLVHPSVRAGLLLEHGCEKTHNDYMRHHMREMGISPERFGWASVQLDGGIRSVSEKVERWFSEALAAASEEGRETVGLGEIRLGLSSVGPVSEEVAEAMTRVASAITGAGGTVVVPENATLLSARSFLEELAGGGAPRPTISYGQVARPEGLHVMECPTDHWVETLTGLGATGVDLVLAHTSRRPVQSHRMVPVLQASSAPEVQRAYADDLDVALSGGPDGWAEQMLRSVAEVVSGERVPKLHRRGNLDFQITRGLLGVST